MKKANLSKRFLAALVDGVISNGIMTAIGTPLPGIGNIVMFALSLIPTVFEDDVLGTPGVSIGRKAFGQRLVNLDGTPVDLKTSIKRNAINAGMVVIGVFTLFIPQWIDIGLVLFRDGRRISDLLMGTRVADLQETPQLTVDPPGDDAPDETD